MERLLAGRRQLTHFYFSHDITTCMASYDISEITGDIIDINNMTPSMTSMIISMASLMLIGDLITNYIVDNMGDIRDM